jgi:hypothetical protein
MKTQLGHVLGRLEGAMWPIAAYRDRIGVQTRFPRGGTTMSKIDTGRVILGGIVAGIICDIFEYVLNGIVLRDQWNTISTSHNLPMIGMNEIVIFNILGLVTGIAAVWAYAAMRPRFGAGPVTAVYAALLIWIVGYVIPNVFQTVSGLVPLNMMLTITVVGLVEIIVATIAGAYIYKEPVESLSPATAR